MGNDQIMWNNHKNERKESFILTIKLYRAVCVSERVFTNAAITAEINLAHRINCELHNNFISIFNVYRLKSFAWNETNGVLSVVVRKIDSNSCSFRGTFSSLKRAKIKIQLRSNGGSRYETVNKDGLVSRADDCLNSCFTCSCQDVYKLATETSRDFLFIMSAYCAEENSLRSFMTRILVDS